MAAPKEARKAYEKGARAMLKHKPDLGKAVRELEEAVRLYSRHASAWHLDLNQDIRSLMSVIPNAEWYETVHHELGHIYYYVSYTRQDIPLLLKGGANRAFHEAIGSLMGLAAMQKPFLAQKNLLPADSKTDEMKTLLKESLNYIIFMPWSCGVMT